MEDLFAAARPRVHGVDLIEVLVGADDPVRPKPAAAACLPWQGSEAAPFIRGAFGQATIGRPQGR